MSSTEPGTPPPPGASASRQLMRWREERGLAGVARGIAHLYGLEPWGVRLAFVATALLGGVGAVLYIALVIALPEVDRQAPETAGRRDVGEFVAMMAGLFAVGILAVVEFSTLKWLLPLMLAVTGAILWQRPRRVEPHRDESVPGGGGRGVYWVPPGAEAGREVRSDAGTGVAAPVAPVAPGASARPADQGPGVERGADLPETGAAGAPQAAPDGVAQWAPADTRDGTPWTRPVSQPRAWVPPPTRPRPSWLGPVAALVALLAMAVLVLAALVGADAVTASLVLGTGVGVLGVALLVGTVWGRAKWVAIPGLVLLAALGVSEVAASNGVELLSAVRNDVSGFRTADELGTMDSSGAVRLLLDDRALAGEPVEAELGAGALAVRLPWDAQVDLRGSVGMGVVHVGTDPEGFGRWVVVDKGLGTPGTAPLRSPWLDQVPRVQPVDVVLDLQVGLGVVELQFDDPPPDVVEEYGLDLGRSWGRGGDVVVDFGPGGLHIEVDGARRDPDVNIDLEWPGRGLEESSQPPSQDPGPTPGDTPSTPGGN